MLNQLINDIAETLSYHPVDLANRMKALMQSYRDSGDTEWMSYKHSNPHSYARNLIYISPLFEAILLVWDRGQVSPIHNHNLSNCFFVVMEGQIHETKYSYQMVGGKKASLTELGSSHFSSGDVAFVSEGDETLHKVASENGKACTLHIYNRPIYKCNIYCPVTGNVDCRKPGFYTIYGKLLDSDITIYKSVYDELEATDSARQSELIPCESELPVPCEVSSPTEKMKQEAIEHKPTFLDLIDHDEEHFSQKTLGGYT